MLRPPRWSGERCRTWPAIWRNRPWKHERRRGSELTIQRAVFERANHGGSRVDRGGCSDPFQKARSEHDVDDFGNGVRAGPVALQLAGQGYPADGLRARLDDAFDPRPVRLWGGPAYRIDDRVHLESLAE